MFVQYYVVVVVVVCVDRESGRLNANAHDDDRRIFFWRVRPSRVCVCVCVSFLVDGLIFVLKKGPVFSPHGE